MIILNEKEYANERLRKNDIGENAYTTINILAKYYYHEQKLKKNEIKELLYNFLESVYPRYATNQGEWADTIDNILKDLANTNLFQSDGVWITASELDEIGRLESELLQKLAFTILCIAKFKNQKKRNNNNWVSSDIKDIYDMACIKCSNKLKSKYVGDLIRLGYIRFASRIDNLNIQVLFLDDESNNELLIDDFRKLGNEYLYYRGGNFVRCADCGLLISNNKNKTRKYCDNCGTYTPMKTKILSCIDCGKAIIVSGSNKRTCRCPECQLIYNRERDRERKKHSIVNAK